MKPQDRTRAIVTSKVESSLRFVLVVIADAMMEERLTCWLSAETIAERTGLCERQVRELLGSAEERGLIRRWSGEHKSRDIEIRWEALAAAPAPKPSTRGRKAGTVEKVSARPEVISGEKGGNDFHPDRKSFPPEPEIISAATGNDCTRSGKGSGSEAGSEAGSARAPDPTRPPKADPAGDLWGTYIALRTALPVLKKPAPAGRAAPPRLPSAPSPDSRKAMSRILTECGGPERARIYLEWVHTSGDLAALRLRGEAAWPNDGGLIVRLDPESLSRHIPARMVEAEAWEARGRTATRAPTSRPSNAPLRRGELFLAPRPHDAHEGAIDIPYEAQ